MLKITTSSLKEGLKEIGKFKSKESLINVVAKNQEVYLTKVLLDEFNQVVTYKLDASIAANENFNVEIIDNFIKAANKIKEDYIELNNLNNEKIELSTTKRNIIFATGKYEFNSELFNFETIEKFNISADKLKILLQVCDYSAKDYRRPILQGVNFKENKVCSLDGYRLALRKNNDMMLNGNYTIHSSVLNGLGAVMKKDSKITFNFNDRQSRIIIDNLTITSNLLEESFIKYESLLSDEYNMSATYEVKELKEEIDFILSIADSKDNSTTKFNINQKEILLKSGSELSTTTINLKDAAANGELEIAFNSNYIMSMLKHFENKITCKYRNAVSPMIIENDEIDGLDLILPIRIIR